MVVLWTNAKLLHDSVYLVSRAPTQFNISFLETSAVLHQSIQMAYLGICRNILKLGCSPHKLSVWLSGNALVSINVVTLRQARLVPGWVTVLGRVDYLGSEPGIQINSACAIPPWVGARSTQQKLGE